METIFLFFTVKVDAVSNYGYQVWGVEYLNFNDDSHAFYYIGTTGACSTPYKCHDEAGV
jgi:hypothetical protein